MADLQTEIFTKVLPKMQQLNNLKFDDDVDTTPEPPVKITNNELIFNWIKAHPAATSRSVVDAFRGQLHEDSVTAQLFTMSSRGLLHKVKCSSTGRMIYSVAMDAYPRSPRADSVARMNHARNALGKEEMARRIREGHKANKHVQAEKKLEPTHKKVVLVKKRTDAPAPAAAVQVTPVDLNTLSIVQARKLYDELKQIFGA